MSVITAIKRVLGTNAYLVYKRFCHYLDHLHVRLTDDVKKNFWDKQSA